MKVLQRQQDVCRVEARCVLLEAADLGKIEEEFAARAILETEKELVLSLPRVVHLDNECVIYGLLHFD